MRLPSPPSRQPPDTFSQTVYDTLPALIKRQAACSSFPTLRCCVHRLLWAWMKVSMYEVVHKHHPGHHVYQCSEDFPGQSRKHRPLREHSGEGPSLCPKGRERVGGQRGFTLPKCQTLLPILSFFFPFFPTSPYREEDMILGDAWNGIAMALSAANLLPPTSCANFACSLQEE